MSLPLAAIWSVNADASGRKHHHPHSTFQTANMLDFTALPDKIVELTGAATMVRTKHDVRATVSATGLDSDAAYTIWWVVFNNPRRCLIAYACGLADLDNRAADPSVYYGTGFVTVGDDAYINISLHTSDRGVPEGAEAVIGRGLRWGNGFGAEIHLVVRTHGDQLPEMVAEQIGSFNGGCDPEPPNFPCADQQIAIFPAVKKRHHHNHD